MSSVPQIEWKMNNIKNQVGRAARAQSTDGNCKNRSRICTFQSERLRYKRNKKQT